VRLHLDSHPPSSAIVASTLLTCAASTAELMHRFAIAWRPAAVDSAMPASTASIVPSSASCSIVTVGTIDGRFSSHTATDWHYSNSLWMVVNYLLP
jgi:hypothetical protein